MSTDLLATLLRQGAKLWHQNGKLSCRAPEGVLTPSLREELSAGKAEVMAQLAENKQYAINSYAQRRLWFFDQLAPDSPTYNMPEALRLHGALNVPVLQQTLSEIVRRHEVLRTTFTAVNGEPVQVVSAPAPLPLPLIDLSCLPEPIRENEASRLATEEAHRPFNLATGPLLRASLLRLDKTEHVFLITTHHIINDGWSTALFFRELAAIYEAFMAGKPSPLPALPIQYADYSIWQRNWLEGEALQQQVAYWKEHLVGAPTLLALPTDRPRPPVQTFYGASQPFFLSESLSQGLKSLSQQEEATLFMTLLAAFQVLLHRYSGQDDIVVGSLIAGRNRAEIEDLIGFFVNTLALRTDLFGNPSFQTLLEQVREVTLEAYAHQDLPFEMLVEELQPARNLSHTPLFQVMFILHNTPKQAPTLPGLRLEPFEAENQTAKFDITLMIEDDGCLSGWIEYNTTLFDHTTITRLLAHFTNLLEAIAATPEQGIDDLSLLSAPERRQLLLDWNDTHVAYPQDKYIHRLFEARAAQSPDAVALCFEDQTLTYEALNQRANQLARFMQSLGVGPERLVGVCLERSLEMVIALLAILKAGAAYVPLDPTYPQERLAFMMADAQVFVLLTQQRLVSQLPAHQAQLICLDTEWPTIAETGTENLDIELAGDNLAYTIYTSGSTGNPKGAMNTHAAIYNRLRWMQDTYTLTPADTVLQKTPFSFDVSVWEFFWPLITGAKLVIARPEGHKDSAYLVDTIMAQGVTTMHFVPSMLQAFVSEPGVDQCHSLQRVICSGEALPADLQQRFFARLDAELHNLYGPTEAAIDVTNWACDPESDRPVVPIGRPIANTQIYLLDSQLRPVPVGVPGELHIGGVCLARGYLKRPSLTAEKFIPNPYGKAPGARLYKTGDLARYLPDGNIEFLGRLDYQVKVRGFRIELGEIEAVLAEHSQIREAVVLAREDNPGDKRLVAYAVPHEAQAPTVSELRAFLQKKLPDYMIPAAFVLLHALPLTPNGKINRRALPAPDTARPDLDKAFAAPRTPQEKILAKIWADILRVDQVGIHDNFFELGGDSLLSLQVINRAKEAGLDIVPRHMFQYQTVAELAAVEGSAPTIKATQDIVTGPTALTNNQQWFFDTEFEFLHHWNVSRLLEVPESFDPVLVEQTIPYLLGHHDALRTYFVVEGSSRQAFIAPPKENVPFSYIDLSGLPAAEQENALEQESTRLQESFDLSQKEPLLRVALFNLGQHKTKRLLIIVHHLVADAASMAIILEDFERVYTQLARNQPVKLPLKTTSVKRCADRLHAYAQSDELRQEIAYWFDLPWSYTPLPLDFPDARMEENTGEQRYELFTELDAEETRLLLQEVPKAYNTKIMDVLLFALVEAITGWTGGDWLPVIVLDSGRGVLFDMDDLDLSRTVGNLVTGSYMILNRKDDDDPGEAIKSIQEQIRQTPNGGYGFELLLRCHEDDEIKTKLAEMRKNDVKFNFLGQMSIPEDDPDELLKPANESSGEPISLQNKCDELLYCLAYIWNGCLHVEWYPGTKFHKQSTIKAVADAYLNALRSLISVHEEKSYEAE